MDLRAGAYLYVETSGWVGRITFSGKKENAERQAVGVSIENLDAQKAHRLTFLDPPLPSHNQSQSKPINSSIKISNVQGSAITA